MLIRIVSLLGNGVRLLRGHEIHRRAFVASPALALVLLLAMEAMVLLAHWLEVDNKPAQFSPEHLVWTLAGALLMLALFAICRRRVGDTLRLAFAWLTCWLPLTLLQLLVWPVLSASPLSATVVYWLGWVIGTAPALWIAIVLGRYALVQLQFSQRATIALMAGMLTLDIGVGWLASQHPYWRAFELPDYAALPAPKPFDEALYYEQPELLQAALGQLPPQRPGTRDAYLLTVAGHGNQAVFDKEARLAQAVLGKHFDALGSIRLANRPDTAGDTPLATRTSVALAIRNIGKIIDPSEDLLVIYLTSHGSSSFEFQLDQAPTDFEPITPQWLAGELAHAGIQRRVVIVSACYSGGYVRPLANEDSLVMTAADSTHTSFGCSDDAELTWFGRALLTDALPKAGSLEAAYPKLQQLISQWETRDELTPSNPQFFIGTRLREWLKQR